MMHKRNILSYVCISTVVAILDKCKGTHILQYINKMNIYNILHVLLSTHSYLFQHLLHHPQGDLYHMLKTIVTLFDYRS